MKPTILHISSDYPDILKPDKTKAIFSLVEGTPEFEHIVYSLNRVNGWSGIASVPFGENRTAVAYGAPPKGLFWESRLDALAQWLIRDLEARGIKPDIVEAHKFTVEGIIGQRVADALSCPLICDIQGCTDCEILSMKIDLRKRYREIAARVSVVFPFAPWAVAPFKDKAGLDPNKCVNLPVVTYIDEPSPAPVIEHDWLLTVFKLESWKRKNFKNLVEAMTILSASRPGVCLDVIGSGPPDTILKLGKIIQQAGMEDRIRLCGAVENGSLPEVMKNYAAFVLPSARETYGQVYAEALFAGLPLLFSRDRGIDGYFARQDIGYACDPASPSDIAAGMNFLLTHQHVLKQGISRMQQTGSLNILTRPHILETYRGNVAMALQG